MRKCGVVVWYGTIAWRIGACCGVVLMCGVVLVVWEEVEGFVRLKQVVDVIRKRMSQIHGRACGKWLTFFVSPRTLK